MLEKLWSARVRCFINQWRGFLKKRLQPPFKKTRTKRPSQVLLWFIGVEDADISLWNDLSVNKQSSLTLRNWPLSSVVFSSGSVFSVELPCGTALKDAFWSGFLRNLVIHRYRAFSLTWPTSMQFFGTMESLCIRRELTTSGLVWNINIAAVHCLGTPMATAVKTLYTERK